MIKPSHPINDKDSQINKSDFSISCSDKTLFTIANFKTDKEITFKLKLCQKPTTIFHKIS